jgi:hypothetical protein
VAATTARATGTTGSGRSTDQLVDEFADMWAFIAHHTGLAPAED